MKRIFSAVICLALLCAMALSVNADAVNMAGGCKMEVTIKKTLPEYVKKDGIIGEGEYQEIAINRDPETTDVLLSWNSWSGSGVLYEKCEQFLQNIHFYISWDEVNGLNMAIRCKMLETPENKCPQPTDSVYGGFPGDGFIFQYGACFATDINDGVLEMEDDSVIHRGFSMNTDTGEYLTGHYGKHGYTGHFDMVAGENFMVKLEADNWVTYEISYPLESVVVADKIINGAPEEDYLIYFTMTATGGSQGVMNDRSETYAVSIGDGGFMSNHWAGDSLTNVKGYFSNELFVSPSNQGTTVTTAAKPVETVVVTEIVKETTVDEDGNVVEVTDAEGNAVTSVVTRVESVEVTTPGEGTVAPSTADPIILAAVVVAISACGAVVSRKRK